MKSTLVYTGVFLLGLVLGYFVNIFVTNRSYYDILSENKELKFQIENLKTEIANSTNNDASFEPIPESTEPGETSDMSSTEEIQPEYQAPAPKSKAAPASIRPKAK